MYTERHFSMPYPLPKLDMAAVPYFSGCAKENFGLIIFCEIELLHHELHSGASCKQWFPEWNIWTQFLQQIAGGLHPNALEQSHPIKVHITQGD
ncbi:aminopeptidase M1 isoform X2 [Vitis vinifera]|nr:aminopeptidase M1 isoform X2 [Vitis vinifera]|eukprot:XP_010648704.1 PREDICTED: aminopeptidase M1-like isoform X3 [Vitis vinifera]